MKKILLFLMLALFCIPWAANAQTTITIGTGTSSDYTFPFNNYYRNSWNEMIYPASAITETGNIVSIGFNVAAVPTGEYPFSTLTIYMGTTSDDVHASTASWLPMDELTEVFSATNVPCPSATGWMTIDLDTPFPYSGDENLVIVVSKTMATYTNALKFYYTAGTSGVSMYRRNDSDASYAQHPGSSTGTFSTYSPNLQLTFTAGGGSVCAKPTEINVMDLSTTSASLTWASEGSVFNLQYKISTADEWTEVNNVSGFEYTLDDLTPGTDYNVRIQQVCEDGTSGWKSINFTTECEIIATYPWAENFDSYTGVTAGTTNNLPNCWDYINTCSYNTYKGYPVIYNGSSYSHSGNNHLRFYTYYGSTYDPQDQYAILPAMADLNGKQLTLYARGANANSFFKVGLMTNPADASTFQEIATTTPTTSYDEYAYILEGEGEYVAIKVDAAVSGANRTIYIDDIAIASCPKPTALAATNVTGNTAELSWTANGGESAWTLYYKKGSDAAYTSVEVTENPYILEGLDASSSYVFYVVANCSAEDLSAASAEYSFATECEAIANLPWDENFDSYNTSATSATAPSDYPEHEMPACWQILNLSETTSTYPQAFITAYSSYAVSGKCLFFKSSSTTPVYAVLPEFAENISGLQLTFTYRNEGANASNGTLLVGYMTDPTDANTFTAVHTCTQITTLTEQEVLFPDAPAGSYIAFKYQGGSSNNYYLSIDNVNVNYAPTCEKPTGVAVSEVTAHTAKLTWTSEASSWQICLNDNEEDIIEVSENPYILEGLDASTPYTVKMRANCGNNDLSYWTTNKSFTTTIACPVPTTLTKTELTAHSVKLNWTEAGQATEWVIAYKVTADQEFIEVPVNEKPYTLNGLEPSTGYTFKVKAVCGGIDGESSWSTTSTFTTTSACPVPTDLVCESVTTTSATLNWFAGENDAWVLSFSQDGEELGVLNVSELPYVLDGLQSGTTYSFKVRTACDTSETWSTSKTFTTGFAIPLFEYFSTTTAPAGWSRYNGLLSGVMAGTTELTSISSIWSFGAGNNGVFDSHAYINIYGTDRHHWLVTPFVEMVDNVQLTFDLALTKYSGSLQPVVDTLQQDDKFVVLITTNGGTSWEVLRQWDNAGSEYVYNNIVCSADGEEVTIDLSNYAGQNIAIAFYGESTVAGGDNNLHIDNVAINYIPSCPKPTDLTATDITSTSAVLNWTNSELANEGYAIYYKKSSDESYISIPGMYWPPYTLEGLDVASTYEYYVKAVCSQSDYSEASHVYTFNTECGTITNFPWTDNFDSHPGATSGTTNNLPYCWSYINTCTYSTYKGYPVIYTASGTSYSGNNHLRFYTYYSSSYSYDPQDQYAILPTMADLNGKQLTLYARGTNANSSFKVGLMTDPTDASTFVEVATTTPTTTYAEYEYILEGEGDYVAIKVEAANSSATSRTVYIDDIKVADPPVCAKPQSLTVSEITAHTASLTWESEATAWQICINDDEDNLIDVDETPYILEGLDGSTTYTVRVRANCGNDGMSLWTANKSFTTAVACPKPTSLTKTELTAHSAKLGWTENGQASEWVIAYKVTADAEFIEVPVNENPYTLYGLEPSTGYTFKVKAVCGGIDGESEYSTTTTFTTTTECPAPTNLVCEGATTTTATLGWFGGENDMWELLVLQGTDTIYDYIIEPEPSYTVEDLLPGTTYTFKVRTYCGESWSSTQTFTTAFSIPFVEPFATTSAPAGWTRYSGLLSDVMGGAALSTVTSGWNFGSGNGITDNHAKVNIYGTTCKYWLVTPSVQMDENVQLTFDMALTVYSSGSSASPTAGNQADDKFVVLINNGTSWEILRQWDNAGSEYVYDEIPNTPTEVTIDLSNYANSEYIAIAFYGESTVTGGDNNMHVDNVKIDHIPSCIKPTDLVVSEVGAHTATLSWTSEGEAWSIYIELNGNEYGSINVTENPYYLDGLYDNESYVVKVRTNCGNDDVSEWSDEVSFTTLVACPAPTNVAVEYNGGTTATVTWESGDEFNFPYYMYINGSLSSEHVTSPYVLEGLELATSYGVQLITDCMDGDEGWSDTTTSVFFTTDLCMPDDMCEITLELTDSYGDGWNGNAIKVVDVQTGTVLGQFANTNVAEAGEAQTYTLAVCDGREISFQWVSGSYAYEASYAVYDVNGEEIFSGEGAMSAAVTYTVDCTVPTCPKPKNLAYAVNAAGVTINWTGESDNYFAQLGVNNPEVLGTVDFEDQAIPQMCENDSLYPWTVVVGHGGYYIQSSNVGVSNSTSAISFIGELEADGTIEFDALCRGEGTSSFYDHCDFYIDEERVLFAGANIEGWNHYKFQVPAGEHTFLWSYTKDNSVNSEGDLFAIDNVTLSLTNITWSEAEAVTGTSHNFAIAEAGEYCVRVQSDCEDEVSNWSNTLFFDFTPTTCVIMLNEDNDYTWFQDFENITSVTTPVTEVEPACWTWNRVVELPEDYADTLPHLYYKVNDVAHAQFARGNYSLRLWNRGTYAMPILDESIDINQVKMSFYSRHSYSFYTLLVGVMTDPEDPETFVPVAYVDNGTSLNMKYFECDFSNYQGNGRYIAFKNVRPSGTTFDGEWGDVHSVNYIDDITLTLRGEFDCSIALPYSQNFDEITTSVNRLTGVHPECWKLVHNDVDNMPFDKMPQVYYSSSNAYSGNYSLRMVNRGIYVMPYIMDTYLQTVKMTMRVRQPNEHYQLQVGVWEETPGGEGTFIPLVLVNNNSTNYELVELDFSNYEGNSTKIAFRNTLNGGVTWDYSYNYIDDIVLEELELQDCEGMYDVMPFTETFENFTNSTIPATGVKPMCWEVVQEDVEMASDKRPQIYYNENFANSGSYTLRMADRCVIAMPDFMGQTDYELQNLMMSFTLRQPSPQYQLEVGIWEVTYDQYQNMNRVFIPIATFNNENDEVTTVSCDFSEYEGYGGRIAFRNTLVGGATNWNYSYNYIDDITIEPIDEARNNASNENLIDEMGVERYLESIAVYPNPTVGELHIGAVDVQKVECYNQMGQLVAVYNNDRDINISALADGVYTLRITVPQGVTMRKVVKR